MTQKEIQEGLLSHYLGVVKACEPLDYYSTKELVEARYCSQGVCWSALNLFNEDIEFEEWVINEINSNTCYWGYIPLHASTKEMILERLQLRIDKLTKILGLTT